MRKDPWLNYLIEALGLGLFMVSAGLFATLLYSPASPVTTALPSGLRGFFMGAFMGITAIAIIYSPPGKRSGAHINPAVTLTFYRLHKLTWQTAVAYIVAQFIGATLGVLLMAILLGQPFETAPIRYAVTVPGELGAIAAFATEFLLSFVLMLMILWTSNHSTLSRLTGIFSGILLTVYIPLASPISGMSINPARTFGSAFPAQIWSDIWIYLIAPPLAMLAAAELYLRVSSRPTRQLCCKLCRTDEMPCVSHRCCLHPSPTE